MGSGSTAAELVSGGLFWSWVWCRAGRVSGVRVVEECGGFRVAGWLEGVVACVGL